MTVKSSVSLSDEHHAFAKALVEAGCYPSLSAVLQQGLVLLRQQRDDADADRGALRALLERRAAGPFVSVEEVRQRLTKARG